MNKKILSVAGFLMTGLFAVAANATSIGLATITSDPFDTVAAPAIIQDATLLKIFRGSTMTLDATIAAADSAPTFHQAPSLITQAMTMPMSAPDIKPVAHAAPASVGSNNDVLVVVSEPSLLLLLGFGLLLVGVSRRNRQ